jgi:hypothetical protein
MSSLLQLLSNFIVRFTVVSCLLLVCCVTAAESEVLGFRESVAVKKENKVLKDELLKYKNQLQSSEEYVENLESEVADLKRSMTDSSAQASDSAEREAALQSELQLRTQNLEIAEVNLTQLQSALDSLQLQMTQLTDELLSSSSGAATPDSMLAEVKAIKSEIDRLSLALANSEESGLELKQENEVLNQTIESLKQQLADGSTEELTPDNSNSEVLVSNGSSSTDSTSDNASTEPSSTDGNVTDRALLLDGRWQILFEDSQVKNYQRTSQAKEQLSSLPDELVCQQIGLDLNSIKGLAERLVVDDYPVRSFWVQNSNGSLATCRVSRNTGGSYVGNISLNRPSSGNWGIALQSSSVGE